VKPLRVFLADDHTLVRGGIRVLLQSIEGMSVVGETGDGTEALAMIRSLRPDLVLLDISMPGLNGLEIAERVSKELPQVRILVLSMHATESYVADALRAGVVGYLRKSAAVAELPVAIEAVSRGEVYLSPGISREVLEVLRSGSVPPGPLAGLSSRQREILQLIAEGHSSKEIGFRLGISSKTVDTHRAQIMERLGIQNIQGLVKFAMRAGLVPEE
jgi:DNA-binding NarL/FixJ family response regulator